MSFSLTSKNMIFPEQE